MSSETRHPQRSMPARMLERRRLPLISILLSMVVGAPLRHLCSRSCSSPTTQFDIGLPVVAYSIADRGVGRQFGGAIVQTLVRGLPLILGGLSVALGFKAGLFDIGAQGQFLMGALGAVERSGPSWRTARR